ncbi:hypothetical protein HD554DRAFT_1991878, partial [Boletus coccyginus]
FAVTGLWIQETSLGVWKLKTVLLSFMQMNSAHNGLRLGQALYKVIQHLGISHKIGHLTCDNMSNMDTMVSEFVTQIEQV